MANQTTAQKTAAQKTAANSVPATESPTAVESPMVTESPTAVESPAAVGKVAPVSTNPANTSLGSTTIADTVVQKIAGLATREVSGVYAVGGGAARAFGAIKDRIPGASASVAQGVSVEVGETQAAVDLDILVEYGVSIPELSRAIRRNVIAAIEHITHLEVVEVNINVNDIHIPGDDDDSTSTTTAGRVQ